MPLLVKDLLNSGHKLSATISGGGTSFFPRLLEAGGASALLVKGSIPYGLTSLHTEAAPWHSGQGAVSQQTAESITINLEQASHWLSPEERVNHVSLSSTAAMKSEGEREGREHRAWISLRGDHKPNKSFKISLPSYLSRIEQEDYLAELLLEMLAEYVGVVPTGSALDEAKKRDCIITEHEPLGWA